MHYRWQWLSFRTMTWCVAMAPCSFQQGTKSLPHRLLISPSEMAFPNLPGACKAVCPLHEADKLDAGCQPSGHGL